MARTGTSLILPASRWFVLVAAIAVLAMVALILISRHLVVTIPPGSPEKVRLVAFVDAAEIGLLLLFGFAMVPPVIREGARLLAFCARRHRGETQKRDETQKRKASRMTDLVAVGVWAVSAFIIAVAAPPLWEGLSTALLQH
jgi:hypothetical protein